MHNRKRIEIVVERVRAEEVTTLLDRLGATGWTILPVLSGRGHQGVRRGGDLSGVLDNVVILCIASDAVTARVMEAREDLLGARPAIVSITDCTVLRADHF
ncbi:P-II family nitrogen regulator [Falsiroseomonas sp. E2-1-a4]|uniref:P-II family nitrogen regulator n=1 Tax=Falsiroseomonas sp. E2-1-a4 TaxID=3239299 RepID=UPI003F386242